MCVILLLRGDKMSFGSKLKDYRNLQNITQEDLAKKLNTTKQVISRYENDLRSPKLSVAIEYAAKLGIPLENLVDDQKQLNINTFLSEHEIRVIKSYREHPEMQSAVDRLLDVQEDTIKLKAVARSADNQSPSEIELTKEKLEEIKNAPPFDEDI